MKHKRAKRRRLPELGPHDDDPPGCKHCHQTEFELIHCNEEEFCDELQVLTHPKLKSFTADSSEISDLIPQFKITQYYVTDEEGHAVALDSGMIERGVHLYVNGYVEDMIANEEKSEISHAILCKDLGPLIEWWFSGFDGSDQVLIGVETELASYILVKANPAYNRFVQHLIEKIFLCKLVIELLSDSPDASYGELVDGIRSRSRSLYNADTLLAHAEFVIQQVASFDETGSEGDVKITATKAFREIIDFSRNTQTSETFGDDCSLSIGKPVIRKDARRLANSDTSAVTTPLVSEFFQQLKLPIMNSSKKTKITSTSGKSKSSSRTGRIRWSSSPVCEDPESGRSYYTSMKIGSCGYKVNDFVVFREEEKKEAIGQIRWMSETRGQTKLLHVLKYAKGRETILGSTAHEKQLFSICECHEISACQVIRPISVLTKDASPVVSKDSAERGDYFCHHSYIRGTGTFIVLKPEDMNTCPGCMPSYRTASLPLKNLKAGDFVGIKSDRCDRKDFLKEYFHQSSASPISQQELDDVLYTEKYRKVFSDGLKGSFAQLLPLLTIARIEEVEGDRILVRLMYRAQNIFSDYDTVLAADVREIFWSNTLIEVSQHEVVKRCSVCKGGCNEQMERNSFDFFLHRRLNYETLALEPFDTELLSLNVAPEQDKERKWKTFDLFSGCGGLALGFKQSGVSETKWAVEKDAAAGHAFEINFPEATVFVADANHIMRDILCGKKVDRSGRRYPEKGEVDIILAGPPCQGFSEMNRFSSGTYSLFKNSLIATTLSFVDYYRPKYLFLENVRNFLKFGNSMIFQITLSCLVRMGYQVRFMLLQAGFYGLPQARSRLFIVAAAPDCQLPHVPQASYSFPSRFFNDSIIIDNSRYSLGNRKDVLYRNMAIRDAISDLPSMLDHAPDGEIDYLREPSSTYQKLLRSPSGSVRDHASRKLSDLNLLRVKSIPRHRGADWRDLPNSESVLPNGTSVKKLEYRFMVNERMKGVCPCASGQTCEGQKERQENTLIPWCLVHTAHRNYHWSGLYGRLHWDEYFSTTVTIPEPSAKQGRVIHPQEDRVLSVRECARSQGFPDDFKFAGSISDRYRQVGNAVAVPVALALAQSLPRRML